MDIELRVTYHIPPLHALPVLRCGRHDLFGIFPVSKRCHTMEKQAYAKCMLRSTENWGLDQLTVVTVSRP